MQLRLFVPVFLQRPLLLVFCIALNSCQSHKTNSGPSLEFTHIPPAAQGGRERVDTISGQVRNSSLHSHQSRHDVEHGNSSGICQPFYNWSEVTKRGRARPVFVLVSLLLVTPLTSDRDGDR
jgi:hypothetical protein